MWQAGKPGSSSFKVHLDGEPLPLAIKADVRQGWVEVLVAGGERGLIQQDGLDVPMTRRLTGFVMLIIVDE